MKTEPMTVITAQQRIRRAVTLVDKALPTVYDPSARDALLDIRLELTASCESR